MALKVIKCEDTSINCFLRRVTEEGFGTITSLENCKNNRKSSIVLGKIIKFIDTKPEEKCVKILVREVLPDGTYGVKFKAVIQEKLGLCVINAALRTGDRLGFFEPCVFNNPAFESPEDITYVLQIGGNKPPVMWYSKKQYILAKPATSKDTCDKIREKETSNETDTSSSGSKEIKTATSSDRNNSPDTRQKPQIQLPVNPQIPSNTQRLNPRYVYKNLAQVKSDALLGDLRRVNIFAVVSEITKGLSKTSTGKYTIICKIVDDSIAMPGELINFDLHFFTPEPSIISEIEQGDILRLHRVKMELYMSDVDGRLFNSQDVILFKKNSPDLTPITAAKNFSLTDEDKRKILSLKKWYKEKYGACLNSLLKDITLLSAIQAEGDYNLVCKIVSQPMVENSKITLSVSDSSVMLAGAPPSSSHTHSQYDLTGIHSGHLVTDIEVFERLDEYSKLKVNDFVFLRSVKATKTNELQLAISTFSFPMILDHKVENVLKIESRLKAWEAKIPSVDNEMRKEDTEEIPDETQGVQVIPPNNDKDGSEKLSDNPQVNCEKCAIKHDSNIKRTVALRNKSRKQKSTSCQAQSTINKAHLGCEQVEISKASCAQKTRKPLFTANYMDLSDATDEASDVMEQVREDMANRPSQVVVPPANLSLENLIELVKTKYCSPRKLPCGQQPSTSHLHEVLNPHLPHERVTANSRKTKAELQTAVVKLVKLTEEECLSLCGNTNNENLSGKKRKTSIDENDVDLMEENLENASTLVNFTLENEFNSRQRNKKLRLETASTVLRPVDGFIKSDLEDSKDNIPGVPREIIAHKVSSWLTQHETKEAEDLDLATVHQLVLNNGTQEGLDVSSFISSHIRRLQVFLLQVIPDPMKEPLDLISGHCFEGCQQLFLYSTIHWKEIDNEITPFCPSCQRTQMGKKLELIFMLQLNVMDRNGNHDSVVVCRDHGITFFGCSVREFVMDLAVRRSRVQLLVDNTVFQYSPSGPFFSPLLDLSLVSLSNIFCVVNSKLKLPPNP